MPNIMPPPPDEGAAQPVDWLRRHYDSVDAEQIVRALSRDYEIRVRAVPCAIRKSMFHIEFHKPLTEMQRSLLVRYCDGYQPKDMVLYYPGYTSGQIGDQLSWVAREAGLMSRSQLIALATFFGIVTPTILAQKGDHL